MAKDSISNEELSKFSPRERMVVSTKNSRGNQSNNKSASSYMAQANVKKFNGELRKKIFNSSGVGRPYVFESVEKLNKELTDYFNLCSDTDTVPTITSLALWLGVNKDTIYSHANNSNSPFHDTLKNCITYCHSLMQSGTVEGKINPVAYIFISKNDYGMRDDKNITVIPKTNDNNINSSETMDAIKKQIEAEHIPEADVKSD